MSEKLTLRLMRARSSRSTASSGKLVPIPRGAMAAGTLIGRIVDADEVAAVVTFLASPRSVAITGDAIACGGGARGAIHY